MITTLSIFTKDNGSQLMGFCKESAEEALLALFTNYRIYGYKDVDGIIDVDINKPSLRIGQAENDMFKGAHLEPTGSYNDYDLSQFALSTQELVDRTDHIFIQLYAILENKDAIINHPDALSTVKEVNELLKVNYKLSFSRFKAMHTSSHIKIVMAFDTVSEMADSDNISIGQKNIIAKIQQELSDNFLISDVYRNTGSYQKNMNSTPIEELDQKINQEKTEEDEG